MAKPRIYKEDVWIVRIGDRIDWCLYFEDTPAVLRGMLRLIAIAEGIPM